MSQVSKAPLQIVGCPFGCRKKFTDANSLNNHISKKHPETKIKVIAEGGKYYRRPY